MQPGTLIVLAAVLAVALAAGQYYVPRAYYTIDAEGHESAPVPLRRLRRSYNPYPAPSGDAWSNSASGSSSWSNANAGGRGGGGWYPPPSPGGYGASAPNAGLTRGVSGTFIAPGASYGGGRMLSTSSSIGLDSTGKGYYDSIASVGY